VTGLFCRFFILLAPVASLATLFAAFLRPIRVVIVTLCTLFKARSFIEKLKTVLNSVYLDLKINCRASRCMHALLIVQFLHIKANLLTGCRFIVLGVNDAFLASQWL
jgi:hypothetical protein